MSINRNNIKVWVADLVAKGLYMNVQYIRSDRSGQQDLVPTNNLLFMS